MSQCRTGQQLFADNIFDIQQWEIGTADRFDDEGFYHHLRRLVGVPEALAMKPMEVGVHRRAIVEVELDRTVAAGKPQACAARDLDPIGRNTLRRNLGAHRVDQRAERLFEGVGQRLQPAGFADRLHIGEADAVGRKQAGKGVDEDPLHAQCVGHRAGKLATSAAKADQRVACDIVAPGN